MGRFFKTGIPLGVYLSSKIVLNILMSPIHQLSLFHKIFLGFVCLTLVLAIAFQFFRATEQEHVSRGEHLENYIRNEVPGWEVRDLPVGETEFMVNTVERILRFDDVLYRSFERNGVNFSIFITYWGEGKNPVREVAKHTPDRCWTTSGWRVVDIYNRFPMEFTDFSLLPTEKRMFTFHGRPMHVKFWHLVGGQPYDSGTGFNMIPNPVRFIQDFFEEILIGRQEQYFIRITSSVPFEEIEFEPAYQALLEDLRAFLEKPVKQEVALAGTIID